MTELGKVVDSVGIELAHFEDELGHFTRMFIR